MTKFLFIRATLAAAVAALSAAKLSADVVTTKSGARIVGKVSKIDAGAVSMSTDFAGDLTIKQSEVVSIATDGPVAVRLASGTRLDGTISGQTGALQIAGPDGTLTTTVDKISASWPAGEGDPALERHWKYEATVDINGTSGNKNQLGTAAGFEAKLVTPEDALDFIAAYNRQVADGVKSADKFRAGVDYSNQFAPPYSWYVRDEAGFDRVMDIKFYDTAAAGLGRDFIKTPAETLTGRAGIAYRYDGYNNPRTPAVNSAALDFEILHDFKTPRWEMGNKLALVPALSNLSEVIVTHDSFYQVPLNDPSWKLRVGVSNDYNGKPGPGIKRLDTTYYTRLIMDLP